jgi:DNA-binding NarL/FixJ family response regulator
MNQLMLKLTDRERDVCDLLLHALPNRQIAERLGITEGAVKSHLNKIFLRNQLNGDRTRNQRIVLALLYYGEKKAAAPKG